MKCERCGNEYNSQYYFATPTICRDCFSKLSPEEQANLSSQVFHYDDSNKYLERASFGKRLAATLIDIIIYGGISSLILYYTGFIKNYQTFVQDIIANSTNKEMTEMITREFYDQNKSALIFAQLIPILYFSLELLIAASVGKLLLWLIIANEDRTRADFGTLFTRYLIKNSTSFIFIIGMLTSVALLHSTVNFLVFVFLVVGYFFILGKKRQAFHDKFSKTIIIKKTDIINREISI